MVENKETQEQEVALRVEQVGMKFNLSKEKVDNLKEYFIKFIKKELTYQEFWALKDVNFEVKKGDRVGIVGLNGAGKSTLLKVIAGVLKPTEGRVVSKGKIVPLLELGAGFDKQYTGAENIYLYGALLGYSKEFIQKKYKQIVEFSELGEFIDVPVKNYSSGMRARLGFSIATVVKPEILILDEVLSVGDARFRKKSEARIQSMFAQGVTVLFVSHSLEQVRRICNKAVMLEHGNVIAMGDVEDVAAVYNTKLAQQKQRRKKKRKQERLELERLAQLAAQGQDTEALLKEEDAKQNALSGQESK
ncbi:MAG: ABC transporter ATP-binding protein [Lachnospiraceae bacterium]|nr:ABC transporter ATP-binding protein [Lachnospiraceae bacterium]